MTTTPAIGHEAAGGTPERSRLVVISALGAAQILAWGSSYYLLAVLAKPIVDDTGWSLSWVIGGVSLGLLVSGLISPWVGRQVDRYGGRPVMAFSAVLLSAGLGGLAVAPNLAVYIVAWLVLGLGMGMGLYDTAFSTLGRLYGRGARSAITALTLWGGFASTVCWPLSALLVEEYGWRGACLIYAGLHVAFALPLYLFGLPRESSVSAVAAKAGTSSAENSSPIPLNNPQLCFLLLATTLTIGATLSAVVSIHLLTILQAREMALGAAVALGALIGPSQVGARIIEMAVARHFHPIWTLAASNVFMAAGLTALWLDTPFVAAALVTYGAGLGIKSIARGTLPLALFGASGYAVLMGRLAMPSLVCQALAPTAGAALMQAFGATVTIGVLAGCALVNVGLVFLLGLSERRAIVATAPA